MTRQEAINWIQAHPSQYRGESVETVLAKTQSSSDPDYYNPTLYVPEQNKTVGARKGRGVAVTYKAAPGTAIKTAAAKLPMPTPSVPAQQSALQMMRAKITNIGLPVMLAASFAALGAGMLVYRATK
jgi:hypothetical protein